MSWERHTGNAVVGYGRWVIRWRWLVLLASVAAIVAESRTRRAFEELIQRSRS